MAMDPSGGSRLAMRRSRGMFTGLMVLLLGAWGALVPFFGPSFHFGLTPDRTWTWTSARGWLEVLPGGVAALGGLMLLMSANRALAVFGGWLAATAGAWYVVGPTLAHLWRIPALGTPIRTSTGMVSLQWLALFYALGGLILLLSGIAIGRLTVRSVADAELARGYAEPATVAEPAAPAYVPGAAVEHRNNRFHIHRHFGRRRASEDVAPASAGSDVLAGEEAAAPGEQQRLR